MDAAWFAAAVLVSYPAFWIQSFDPNFKMELHETFDLGGPSEVVTDEAPSFFSIGALGWACAFAIVLLQSEDRCSLTSESSYPVVFWAGVLAVAVTVKALFGPMGQVHKRTLKGPNHRISRPFIWRLFDTLAAIPTNATVKVLNKLMFFPIFAVISWVMHWMSGSKASDSLVIPEYAFLTFGVLFLGRLSTIYVNRQLVPWRAQQELPARKPWRGWRLALIYLVCMGSFLASYVLLEGILKACGMAPNSLPSLFPLLLGVLVAPTISLALAAATGAISAWMSDRA